MKTATTQINFRIPTQIKQQAMEKAQKEGVNINFLVKLFLKKYAEQNNIVNVSYTVNMENIFDEGILQAYKDKKVQKSVEKINMLLVSI